jgi:hypothetical protein
MSFILIPLILFTRLTPRATTTKSAPMHAATALTHQTHEGRHTHTIDINILQRLAFRFIDLLNYCIPFQRGLSRHKPFIITLQIFASSDFIHLRRHVIYYSFMYLVNV